MRFFPVFLAALIFSFPAVAQSTYGQCGAGQAALETSLDPDPGFTYCDIHSRRLIYRQNQKKYRDAIEQRRNNFYTVNADAKKAYKAALEEKYTADIEAEEEAMDAETDDMVEDYPDPEEGGPVILDSEGAEKMAKAQAKAEANIEEKEKK